MSDLDKILKERGLRKTAFRRQLLGLFHEEQSSLTAEEIREALGPNTDKVTVYRTLDTFEKKGLIHLVPDKSNLNRYALCQQDGNGEHHHHNHAHFICNSCHTTFCLDDIVVPAIPSTKGFIVTNPKLTLEGVCPKCSEEG